MLFRLNPDRPVPDMPIHAVHPGEDVQEHGVPVQEAEPRVVLELVWGYTQQIPHI